MHAAHVYAREKTSRYIGGGSETRGIFCERFSFYATPSVKFAWIAAGKIVSGIIGRSVNARYDITRIH